MSDFTIAQLVTYQVPETESDLIAEDWQPDYSEMKAACIARAKSDLYGLSVIPAESAMLDAVKFYIADCSVVFIVDAAIDFYKSRSRMADTKEGATFTYYDKVMTLENLRKRLLTRIAVAQPKITGIVFGTTDLAQAADLPTTEMLAAGKSKVTVDPFTLARWLYGDYLDLTSDDLEPYPLYPVRPQ